LNYYFGLGYLRKVEIVEKVGGKKKNDLGTVIMENKSLAL